MIRLKHMMIAAVPAFTFIGVVGRTPAMLREAKTALVT